MAVRFLHIPKTAGTSFTGILIRQYGTRHVFAFTGDADADQARYEKLSADEKKSIRLFTGHAPLTTGVQAADEADIITILRDPIRRVKSFCQHVFEGKSPYLLGDFPPEKFRLDEFLKSGNGELANLQTKMLLSHHSSMSFPLDTVPVSEALELASMSLFQKVTAYGLQEYFDESLIFFAARMRWRTPSYTSANQMDPRRTLDFEPQHVEAIRKLNEIDLALYELAKQKFIGAMAGQAGFDRTLASFRFRNQFARIDNLLTTGLQKINLG